MAVNKDRVIATQRRQIEALEERLAELEAVKPHVIFILRDSLIAQRLASVWPFIHAQNDTHGQPRKTKRRERSVLVREWAAMANVTEGETDRHHDMLTRSGICLSDGTLSREASIYLRLLALAGARIPRGSAAPKKAAGAAAAN